MLLRRWDAHLYFELSEHVFAIPLPDDPVPFWTAHYPGHHYEDWEAMELSKLSYFPVELCDSMDGSIRRRIR